VPRGSDAHSSEPEALVTQSGFDLSTTHVHLGLGSRATPIPDFEWSPDFLARYAADYASDGDEGRLVLAGSGDSSWTTWERHPAGEELVVVVSGRMTLVQELDGVEHRVELAEGEAAINPRNVWHTADIAEPCRTLFITPGRGTEHRPR
jgi:mannose-6-phosphate isomerase-like protein (cupin superfamily)